MLCDMHTHSFFSPDANPDATIEKMAETAKSFGLDYITVTDHCDCVYWDTDSEHNYHEYQKSDSMMFGARRYAAESIKKINELKEKYPWLLCGTELGEPLQAPEAAGIISSMKELDLVIGSLHMNAGKPDFYWMNYSEMTIDEIRALLEDYFNELYQMCASCSFDVLGHLTYPLRYIQGEYGIDIDIGIYRDRIEDIFRVLIENGKGIEINTSGLRQKYGKTFPDTEYIRLYHDLGGEIITVGSDAHSLKDIGAGIKDGTELAEYAGFRYTAVFKNRKAEFVKI